MSSDAAKRCSCSGSCPGSCSGRGVFGFVVVPERADAVDAVGEGEELVIVFTEIAQSAYLGRDISISR